MNHPCVCVIGPHSPCSLARGLPLGLVMAGVPDTQCSCLHGDAAGRLDTSHEGMWAAGRLQLPAPSEPTEGAPHSLLSLPFLPLGRDAWAHAHKRVYTGHLPASRVHLACFELCCPRDRKPSGPCLSAQRADGSQGWGLHTLGRGQRPHQSLQTPHRAIGPISLGPRILPVPRMSEHPVQALKHAGPSARPPSKGVWAPCPLLMALSVPWCSPVVELATCRGGWEAPACSWGCLFKGDLTRLQKAGSWNSGPGLPPMCVAWTSTPMGPEAQA